MIDPMRTALAGPHGVATLVTWGVAGVALALALAHAVRPGPRHHRWSRAAAAGFPAAIALTLLTSSVVPRLDDVPLRIGMTLRFVGFWATVTVAPHAVGQVFGLRPPRWLTRAHLALAGTFLLLLATSDLVVSHGPSFSPATQFGPLAVALLVPVPALAGWWLLACLWRAQFWPTTIVFALGGASTTLALVIAALVVDATTADHMLVVAFLPTLAAAVFAEAARAWRDRPLRPGRHRRSAPTAHK